MILLGNSKHVARKVHHCDSCLRKIEPGDLYHRARVVDGGEAWVWKAHDRCQRIGRVLMDHGIEGDEGTIIAVCDMEDDDWALIRSVAPELAP